MLPAEPAGTIATRTAGAIEVVARLTWRERSEVPPAPVLPALPGENDGVVRTFFSEENKETTCSLCGEIRAFTEEDLRQALDAFLREINRAAALGEVVLETRAVCLAPPRIFPSPVRKRLGQELQAAGFGVRFAPSWTPVPDADVCLGVRGAGEWLEKYFRESGSWKIVMPGPDQLRSGS